MNLIIVFRTPMNAWNTYIEFDVICPYIKCTQKTGLLMFSDDAFNNFCSINIL